MKIILLHGDNSMKIADRVTKFVDTAIARSWKIERINMDKEPSLRNRLGGLTLLPETRFYILDNPKKIKKADFEWLKKNHEGIDGTLIVVNYGILGKTIISALPTLSKVEEFPLPQKIWSFLDSFYPGNVRTLGVLLHEVLASEAPELLVALLARHLHDIAIIKKDASLLNYQPWRIGKLKKQADKFSKSELAEVIAKLADADFAAKTGRSDLVSELDLLIAIKLE